MTEGYPDLLSVWEDMDQLQLQIDELKAWKAQISPLLESLKEAAEPKSKQYYNEDPRTPGDWY